MLQIKFDRWQNVTIEFGSRPECRNHNIQLFTEEEDGTNLKSEWEAHRGVRWPRRKGGMEVLNSLSTAAFMCSIPCTEMAHGADDSPRMAGTCSTVGSTLRMKATEVPWTKGGKVGAVRDSEPVTVTFVVTDVLKVALSFSSLANRMQATFGLQRGSIQRKGGIIEMDRQS